MSYTQNKARETGRTHKFSRRTLMKLAAASVLVGCQPDMTTPTQTEKPQPSPMPTPDTTIPAPTSTPTIPPEPTPTTSAVVTPEGEPTVPPSRADITQVYPAVPSKVIRTHHGAVWANQQLVPEALSQMLDAGISHLTGLDNPGTAWSILFSPEERVAIKVNTIRGSDYWTHVPLVLAVTEKLKSAGIPPEQIFVFDRYSSELESTGYPINKNPPGIQCLGTDDHFTNGWQLNGKDLGISDILLECDALINMPVLKNHGMSGLSFALKNHYGTINQPSRFHDNFGICIAELNALEPIRDRTRLIIGDELTIVQRSWKAAYPGDSILMSFDPVAHDTAGLQLYEQAAGGGESAAVRAGAESWLSHAAGIGVGTDDPNHIKLVEVAL